MVLCFEDYVGDKRVLTGILRKYLEFLNNHWVEVSFTSEWIDFDQFSWISAYFFKCHSLLKQCLQKGHWLESAWWSPLQLEHLNIWEHSLPFLVSSLGGLILAFALQHQPNSLWCSDLCKLLYLMHLASWILHEKVACSHFQQFLH